MTTTSTSGISLSESLLIIQAVILFIGLGITAYSIRNNRIDNRRRATVDLILHQRSNQVLNDAADLVGNLANSNGDFPDLSVYLDQDKYPQERKAVLMVLNYREFVAVGINTGIIDEQIYKRAFYNIVIRDWKYLDRTVHTIRCSSKGHSTNFQDFEKLYKHWDKNKLERL